MCQEEAKASLLWTLLFNAKFLCSHKLTPCLPRHSLGNLNVEPWRSLSDTSPCIFLLEVYRYNQQSFSCCSVITLSYPQYISTGQWQRFIPGNSWPGRGSLQDSQGAHRGPGVETNTKDQDVHATIRVAAGGHSHPNRHHLWTHHGSHQDVLAQPTRAGPLPPTRGVSTVTPSY